MPDRTLPPPSEAEVVARLKRGLLAGALHGTPAGGVIVDADGSYTGSPFAKGLRPFGVVRIGGWRPDLVCAQERAGAERVLAFEVKGERDHEKGVVQAARYRPGAHEAYLCVPREPDGWLRDMAARVGVGLVAATTEVVRLVAEPAPPLPDTASLEVTRRRILGERTFAAFGLNKPLHYAAAVVAYAGGEPDRLLRDVWGLSAASARLAVRGAETLGLLDRGALTARGWALTDVLGHFGFRLERDRGLTGRRLADAAPEYAAVLRLVQGEQPAVQLVTRVLAASGGRATVVDLATRSHAVDPGLAGAVFGEPPAGARWLPRATTVYQLKAQLYDTGVLESPLARGAGRLLRGGYDPQHDWWIAGVTGGEEGSSVA